MTKAANQELNAHEIRDRNAQGTIRLRGRDPRKIFYMAISAANLDGSLDEPSETAEGIEAVCDTEEEAVAEAHGINDSYPTLDVWIFKCVPVARVWRGKTRVTKLK